MRYRIENLTRCGAGNSEEFLKSTRREVRAQRPADPMVPDHYSLCSHALKAYRYNPRQGNVFDFILLTCEKVRKDYGRV